MNIRIGTRGSKMALYQASVVAQALQKAYPQFTSEIVPIVTDGERIKGNLQEFGGKGAFVRQLDIALVSGEIDVAVNCMKDIPHEHERTKSISIAAVLPRDDIRDVAICRVGQKYEDLPEGSVIGTASPRRQALIARSDKTFSSHYLRGSADTRIKKLDKGEVDAIILAAAGIERIDEQHRVSKYFSCDEFLPAIGAGIITIDCLSNDEKMHGILKKINHHETYSMMLAERALVNTLRGNCHTALGGYSSVSSLGEMSLTASVFSEDGLRAVSASLVRPLSKASELGTNVAQLLLEQGADELINPSQYNDISSGVGIRD